MNRRALLRAGASAALAGVVPLWSTRSIAAGAGHAPLAITDITVRRELQADFPRTLRALKKIGYTHFGTRLHNWSASEPPEPVPAEKARMLADAGLRVGAARLGSYAPLEQQIEDAQTLGAKILVLSAGRIFLDGMRPRTPSVAEFHDYLGELDRMGRQVRSAGLIFAYHNHDFDARPIGGERAFDQMISGTDPGNVHFELDLAWAAIGGYDPLDLVTRLGSRLVSLHFKDVDGATKEGPRLVAPGDGRLNYAKLVPAIRLRTHALAAVEVDAPADGLVTAARAYAFLKRVMASEG